MEKTKIDSKIAQIANCVIERVQKTEINNTPIGLYTGDSGDLLFLFYYSIYSKDETIELSIDSMIECLMEKLSSHIHMHTYCSGLAGVLYVIDFFNKKDFVDIDLTDAKESLENYLIRKMRDDINSNYYDFMHGALGVGLYFLNKGHRSDIIEELLNYLYNTADKGDIDNTFKWESLLNQETGERGYNIALSHGMASIVLFLSRCVQKNIENQHLQKMLINTVSYVLSQEIDSELYGSHFPSQSKAKIFGSRLAWCYGDLGVAFSIYYAGKITQNEQWEEKGLNILLDSTKRKVEESGIRDAGICHGCAGIAMIYRRMYLDTSLLEFLDATEFWTKEIFNYANNEDGLVGFKTFSLKEEEKDDYSLLTGVSGIGLYLISYITKDEQSWDELFLLS